MGRQRETKEEIDYVSKNYMCITQEFIMLKEIALSLAIIADVLKEGEDSEGN